MDMVVAGSGCEDGYVVSFSTNSWVMFVNRPGGGTFTERRGEYSYAKGSVDSYWRVMTLCE